VELGLIEIGGVRLGEEEVEEDGDPDML